MNKQEIDEVFKDLKEMDKSKLIHMSGVDTTGWTEGHLNKRQANLVMDTIMAKIEQGDYEYFLSKIEDTEYRGEFFSFMSHSSKVDDIKRIINAKEKLNIPIHYLRDLIIATKEPDYMIDFLENDEKRKAFQDRPAYVIEIIKSTNKPEYIAGIIENNEKREKFGFSTNEIADLAISMNNPSYVENIVSRREEFDFSQEETVAIIAGGTPDFIKGIIEDTDKIKKFGLSSKQIIDLIIATGEEYAVKIIKNKEKLEKFGFNRTELGRLVLATGKESYINDYLKQYETKTTDKKIKLPTKMTIGIEVESEGIASKEILSLSNILEEGWECKQDLSTDDGVEVVSPILTGDTEQSTEAIKSVCFKLQVFGQTVSEKCGGHVHIGADYLTTRESWENLIDLWGNTEEILYIISNKAGEIPRDGVPNYARPISKNFEEMLAKGTVQLDSIEDLQRFAKKSQINEAGEIDRYFGINFSNLENPNTIEFRLANGTIDEETWIENINLFGGIVRASEELARIEQKSVEDRTPVEQKMLDNHERLKYLGVSEQEKLELLLSLVVPEEDRNIYRERYEKNSELIKQNPETEREIIEQVAKSPTDVKKARRWQKFNPIISSKEALEISDKISDFESQVRGDFEERQNEGNSLEEK